MDLCSVCRTLPVTITVSNHNLRPRTGINSPSDAMLPFGILHRTMRWHHFNRLTLVPPHLPTRDSEFHDFGQRQPLRFTFIVWIMVIVGGSGNNLGSIFGGFFVWFMWIEAEPLSIFIVQFLTNGLDYDNVIRLHLIKSAPHFSVGLERLEIFHYCAAESGNVLL